MNHSCTPNAVFNFEGPQLRVRSTEIIPAGEEITISYVDLAESFDWRQEELKSKYFFDCKCKKCEKEARDPELDGRIKEAQNSLRILLQSDHKTTSIEAAEEAAAQICLEGCPGKRWPCDLQPIPMLQVYLASGYQGQGRLVKSFKFWVKTCFETDPLIWRSQYTLRRVKHFMRYLGVEV